MKSLRPKSFSIGGAEYLFEEQWWNPFVVEVPALANATGKKPDVFVWNDLIVRRHPKFPFQRLSWPKPEPLLASQLDHSGRCAIRAELLEELVQAGTIAHRNDTSGALAALAVRIEKGELEIVTLRDAYRFTGSQRSQVYQPRTTPRPSKRASSISIIINYRDRPELMKLALQSIARQRVTAKVEVVLVNNQSRSENVRAIHDVCSQILPSGVLVTHVDYDAPFNHSAQCNLAAEKSSGEVLILMNNDAYFVDEGALQEISDWAMSPGIGTAGPRILGKEGRLVSAGVEIFASDKMPGGFGIRETEVSALERTIHYNSGSAFASAAVPRSVWRELGGLNAQAFPSQYNDADFFLRCTKRGYRHLYVGGQTLYHEPGASEARTKEATRRRLFELCALHPEMAQFEQVDLRLENVKFAPERYPLAGRLALKLLARS